MLLNLTTIFVALYPQYAAAAVLLCVWNPVALGMLLCATAVWTYMVYDSTVPRFWINTAPYVDAVTDDTPSKARVIYACHPHGIMPASSTYFQLHRIPVVVARTVLVSLVAPIGLRFMGCIDNTRGAMIKAVCQYGAVAVYPGGADEMCQATLDQDGSDVFVRVRDGVIRLAIQQNCTLVPVWVPSELRACRPLFCRFNAYKSWIWERFRVAIAPNVGRFGIPFVPVRGRYPIHHGTGIECHAGRDTVDSIRARYIEELHRLAQESGHSLRVHCTNIHVTRASPVDANAASR